MGIIIITASEVIIAGTFDVGREGAESGWSVRPSNDRYPLIDVETGGQIPE